MKEQPRAVYRSMQGKEIDMHKLSLQNEMTVAVSNVKVNARGDELGPGGRIIRKREDVLKEYYAGHPNTAPEEAVSTRGAPEETEESQPVVATVEETITSKLKKTGE
jgi:hypothetical protein